VIDDEVDCELEFATVHCDAVGVLRHKLSACEAERDQLRAQAADAGRLIAEASQTSWDLGCKFGRIEAAGEKLVQSCSESALLSMRAERDQALDERDQLRTVYQGVLDAMGNGADDTLWRPGDTLGEAVARLVAELDEAREVLSDVQWGSRNCCLECGRHLCQGHAPDCRLAAVLRGRG